MQSENKCQDVMSSQGLQLSSLCQLSLGLSFLKSCLFDRTLSPQICHFSLQARLEQKLCFQYFGLRQDFPHFIWTLKGKAHQWLGLIDSQRETTKRLLHPNAAPRAGADAVQACCIAGRRDAGSDCGSHILGVIYMGLIGCVAILGLD